MVGMTAEDVFELKGVADPRLSPDGRTAAFAVWSVDGDANEYRGSIWLATNSPSRQSPSQLPYAFTNRS